MDPRKKLLGHGEIFQRIFETLLIKNGLWRSSRHHALNYNKQELWFIPRTQVFVMSLLLYLLLNREKLNFTEYTFRVCVNSLWANIIILFH